MVSAPRPTVWQTAAGNCRFPVTAKASSPCDGSGSFMPTSRSIVGPGRLTRPPAAGLAAGPSSSNAGFTSSWLPPVSDASEKVTPVRSARDARQVGQSGLRSVSGPSSTTATPPFSIHCHQALASCCDSARPSQMINTSPGRLVVIPSAREVFVSVTIGFRPSPVAASAAAIALLVGSLTAVISTGCLPATNQTAATSPDEVGAGVPVTK